MKKRILLIGMILVLSMSLLACGSPSGIVDAGRTAATRLISGEMTGQVAKAYKAQWFDFTVKSIEIVDSYAGYSPEAGNVLVDVVLEEIGTFSEPSPMGTFDFYFDHNTFEEYIFPMDPLDDTMMPLEFDLAKDVVVEYHMVYELPAGLVNLKLMYTEIDEEENEGVTFSIPFSTAS